MALPTTSWTDESLDDQRGYVVADYVEEGYVEEWGGVPESMPTSSFSGETPPTSSWTDE